MAIIERTYGKESNVVIDEVLISSDSHVIEPEGLWKKQLPKVFQDRAPGLFTAQSHRGASLSGRGQWACTLRRSAYLIKS
jgi:hypothetical protein